MAVARGKVEGWGLALWVRHFGFLCSPITTMNRLFKNKRKKSPEPSLQGISPGVPTNATAGPANYQAQSSTGPEGGQILFSFLGRPDLTTALDKGSGGGSQIAFQDRMEEDQKLHASGARTSGVVVGTSEYGNNPTSECL